jgi:hypothetical protein
MNIDSLTLPVSPDERVLLSDAEKWQITVEIGRRVLAESADISDLAQLITNKTGLEFTFGAIFALQQN